MKNFSVLLISLFFVTDVFAGVRMLGDSGGSVAGSRSSGFSISYDKRKSSPTYKVKSGREWCIENGYNKTSCEGMGGIIVTCPKDSYYVHCCPPKYRFKKEFCESRGYSPSDDDCMGYHRCMVPAPAVP